MRCLYCGTRLSLLRRFADGEFCSDAHREAHQRLQDELALTRLADTRSGRAGSQPKAQKRGRGGAAGLPPHAPLLPQAAVWIDCRRVVPLPVQPAVFLPVHFLPESSLRAIVRGLPTPPPSIWQVAVPPKPANGTLPNILPVLSAEVDAPQPLSGAPPAPAEDPAAPPQPLLPLPVQPYLREEWPLLEIRPLPRRKLVVIVPKSGLGPQTGQITPASFVAWTPALQPARAAENRPTHGEPARLATPPVEVFPAPPASLDPPDWVKATATAEAEPPHRLDHPSDPPLRLALFTLAAPPAVPAAFGPSAAVFGPLPTEGCTALPRSSGAAMIVGAEPRLRPLARLNAALPPPARQVLYCAAPARWFLAPVEAEQEMPRLHRAASACWQSWPVLAGLAPLATPPVGVAVPPCAVPLLPAPIAPNDALAPAVSRPLPLRQLRLAHRVLAVEPAAAAVFPLAQAAPPSGPGWTLSCAAPPPLRLDLQPPDPLCPAPAAPDEVQEAGLHALGRAVAACHESDAADSDPVRFRTGRELAAEDSALPAAPPVADREQLEPALEPAPGVCGRLPVMPVRPLDSPCRPVLASSASVRSCWATLDDLSPAHPSLRLELDHADGSGPRRHAGQRPSRIRLARTRGKSRFWAHAPSDLKWIAVALPLLLVVVVYSFSGNKPNIPAGEAGMAATTTARAASGAEQPWLRVNALQRMIMRRAGVRLFDDFRGGLGSWQGNNGWAKTWRYGDATFVQPGDLALLSPSLGFTDYTLTFLGQIERRSLNWVFRAKDLDNYYSMRIAVTRSGPLPEAVLVRSVVINGSQQEVKSLPIPFPVQPDTLYLVRMEVRGNDFTTYVQNQIVDHFSDSRLKSGGIGFYSPRGDRALLRWVEISHQYDYLGRLCALLSPYGVQNLPAD